MAKKSAGGSSLKRKNCDGIPAREGTLLAKKALDAEATAGAIEHNENKTSEYDPKAALTPPRGQVSSVTPEVAGSTLSELNTSAKTGTLPTPGENATAGSLDRVRADSQGRALTTNQGVPVANNQDSLKAGFRGPALLKDFILREKITHFDHERIPERIVHARGSGAHGFFECYESLSKLTSASLFSEAGKQTPVFVRFSTVAGERGSKDTARDVRGFAVKFYTDEGNFDLVGNNMPVFFIQDAMKFPDLVHAVKPEPHHAMPQAASAHDTFWDFVSLMPESTHMLMWVMSDRAIPRSFRMMQGFGVHTFRLVSSKGESTFVKFHWNPKLGTHSLVWDEAVKVSGADPDFHRRDLWEAIEAGNYPEWELGVQLFSEEDAERFSFDVLDATKIVPEELVPVTPIGRLVLNRNPDNFFAETEQVAFCAAHIVPGIDFSNDPLLAGRIHSYVDTQISRLGGPNFHEIPINGPLAPPHNNQRDGMHRQTVHHGRVAYEPSSLGGGCPFQAGKAGFVSFPEPVKQDEVRGKAEKFAEHFNQASLFYESQTEPEKKHIAAAFTFELSKCTVEAVRRRVVSMLRNVSEELAETVAAGMGMDLPPAMPRAIASPPKPEVLKSPTLSLTARSGEKGIETRKIAVFVAADVDVESMDATLAAIESKGALAFIVGPRVGPIGGPQGDAYVADGSFDTHPGPLFDAVALPDGVATQLAQDGRALEFLRDQYRHCKAMLAIGSSASLLTKAGISTSATDPGLIVAKQADSAALDLFVAAVQRHRHFARETDPPLV